MELTELKLEYAVCGEEKSGIPVIIVAAGASSRMGGINKQADRSAFGRTCACKNPYGV